MHVSPFEELSESFALLGVNLHLMKPRPPLPLFLCQP